MKQATINSAYTALMKLQNYKLPVKKAYAIYQLCKVLETPYKFAVAQERKYLDECHGAPGGDGTVKFPTPAECTAFKEKIEALNRMDVELEPEPVELGESDLGDQMVTPADIAALEGLVSFE